MGGGKLLSRAKRFKGLLNTLRKPFAGITQTIVLKIMETKTVWSGILIYCRYPKYLDIVRTGRACSVLEFLFLHISV